MNSRLHPNLKVGPLIGAHDARVFQAGRGKGTTMKNTIRMAVGVAIGAVAVSATAQVRQAYQYPAESQARGIQLGGSAFWLSGYAGIGLGYDDNLFQSSTNEKSSNLFLFSPGLTLSTRTASTNFELKYQAQVGRYGQSSNDNYTD